MAVLRRPLLPGGGRISQHAKTTVQMQLPLLVAICFFCFLFGLLSGGAIHLSRTIEPAAGHPSSQGTVAPRRLQAQQAPTSLIHKEATDVANSEDTRPHTVEPQDQHQTQLQAPPPAIFVTAAELKQQQHQHQHQVVLHTPPGELPGNEEFAQQFLQQSGLLQLRPPLQPAVSGNNFYTVVPYQILSWYPRILVFPNFIPKAKAQHIIDIAKGRMAPSGLAWRRDETPDPDQQTRTSTGVFLSRLDDPDGVLSWLEEKISTVTLLPVNHGEAFNILRYELNQRYESHMDTFDPKDFGPQPSQRMATMLFYLSEVLDGGETVFKREGQEGADREVSDWASCEEHEYKYKPRLGDAVLFYSLDPDLTINKRSLHGGCAVTKGEKWVATKWIHEKPVH